MSSSSSSQEEKRIPPPANEANKCSATCPNLTQPNVEIGKPSDRAITLATYAWRALVNASVTLARKPVNKCTAYGLRIAGEQVADASKMLKKPAKFEALWTSYIRASRLIDDIAEARMSMCRILQESFGEADDDSTIFANTLYAVTNGVNEVLALPAADVQPAVAASAQPAAVAAAVPRP